MNTLYRWMAGLFALAALTGPAVCQGAIGYQLTGPVVHDNLAVYFVRGNGAATAPLTLDQAIKSGQAQVRWTRNDPITVENLSGQSIFVPFGALLTGGLQDQVVGTSFILPPHSGPIPLATFCVDPFRSTARDGEAADKLAPAGMFPGRMAKLAMLVAAPKSRAVRRMRQSGVWWSIDSTRAQLARNLGVAVEPARETHWEPAPIQDQVSGAILGARQSSWRTSLPLALENRALIDAQQAYVSDLEAPAAASDIVGAVFAVNGSLDGAEIYQSHALFGAMWPQLLRAHAAEAIAVKDRPAAASPALETVDAFLASAQAGAARNPGAAQGVVLRDSDRAIYAETRDRGGSWINRSFVATAHPAEAAGTPEAMLLGMLETGHLDAGTADARRLASLGDRDVVVLRRDASGEGWVTAIEQPESDRAFDALLAGPDGLAAALIGIAFFAMLFFLLAPLSQARRSRIVHSRFGEGPIVVETVRRPAPAMIMKAIAACLMTMLRRARRAASPDAVSAVARGLGPAWPANFRPAPHSLRVRITK